MSESTTEDLGAGYSLRLEDNDDGGTRATLVKPDGEEETIVGGHEHESPEDMTWHRDLEDIFRAGLNAGIEIGKASK
jgi:hypothetical protein